MIRELTLKDVGPARDLRFSFSPRLNVLTGDNGLGKTFVLDVVWWVLTTTWAGEKAFPFRPAPKDFVGEALNPQPEAAEPELNPEIAAVLTKRDGDPIQEVGVRTGGAWRWDSQEWIHVSPGRPPPSLLPPQVRPFLDEAADRPASLVLYARIDGSFALFDSYYVREGIASFSEAAIVLSPSEVWNGKPLRAPDVREGNEINGLIHDWVGWQQREKSPEFHALRKVLDALSSPDEPLIPSEPTRVHLRDRRDIPTLVTSYGVVPVTLASAGMKRALSLAYLLVWAWFEHEKAAKASRRQPTRDIVVLIDEPELHLHPGWQRTFLPAVLKAVNRVAPNAGVQVVTATHSPLVLASLENAWVESLDDLFVMERDGSMVRSNQQDFVREGDVTAWLASTVFGGVAGRSRGAELAIEAAQHFMADRTCEAEQSLRQLYSHLEQQPRPATSDDDNYDGSTLGAEEGYLKKPQRERVHDALKHTLPGHDEFWVHWTLVYRPGRRTKEGFDATR
jgi:hypothetical protein